MALSRLFRSQPQALLAAPKGTAFTARVAGGTAAMQVDYADLPTLRRGQAAAVVALKEKVADAKARVFTVNATPKAKALFGVSVALGFASTVCTIIAPFTGGASLIAGTVLTVLSLGFGFWSYKAGLNFEAMDPKGRYLALREWRQGARELRALEAEAARLNSHLG